MREYLAINNLRNATMLGIVIGLMAVPRILDGSDQLTLVRVVAVFPLMIILAGAVTAWGGKAGMAGAFPDAALMRKGVWIALAMGVVIAPIVLWQDSWHPETPDMIPRWEERNLPLPSTLTSCLALMLWSAGFETLFFRATTMAFFARISKRQWTGVIGAVLLSLAVRTAKLGSVDMDLIMVVRLAGMSVLTAMGCMFYARAGLPAAIVFAAALDLRHVARWLLAQ